MRIVSRYAAFGIHLVASFVLFLVLAAIIKFLWYPGVLFETEGGWDGIKLIAGVDLVIGPTLTLIVYNVAKKELKRDLAIIGLLQALCIVGGMATVAYSRPVAVIYAAGTFFVATQVRFDAHDINTNAVALFDERKPVWLAVAVPMEPSERIEFLRHWTLQGGIDLATSHYQPLQLALTRLRDEGMSLTQADDAGYAIPTQFANSSHIRVFILSTRYGKSMVICDVRNGELLQVVSSVPTLFKQK